MEGIVHWKLFIAGLLIYVFIIGLRYKSTFMMGHRQKGSKLLTQAICKIRSQSSILGSLNASYKFGPCIMTPLTSRVPQE